MNPGTKRPLAERFWMHVDKDGPTVRPELGPCWIWTASLRDTGYGQIMNPDTRIPEKAHRVSWMLEHGEMPPPTVMVCHSCDVRKCVRPSHLFLGTNADNVADMIAKCRLPRGAGRTQSKLTEDNVHTIRRLAGELTQGELSGLFGVNQAAVSRIISRKVWAHV